MLRSIALMEAPGHLGVELKDLPLTQLRAFEAVARNRSFSKGAKELGVSSVMASLHVKQLEQALGAQLLERSRPIRITPAGVLLLFEASDALGILARAFQRVREGDL